MLTATFQKTSVGWQFRKLYQRLSEWLTFQLSRWQPEVPHGLPSWWLETLFWLIIGLLLCFSIWQLYRILTTYWPLTTSPEVISRKSNLLSHQRVSLANWLSAAQAFEQQQNYSEACRALYMAMIEKLQDNQLVPDDDSLTDGEYALKLTHLPHAGSCQLLLQTHESLKFGNALISAEQFQQCQQAYRLIEEGLK